MPVATEIRFGRHALAIDLEKRVEVLIAESAPQESSG